MIPAKGATAEITRAIRRIEREDGVTFREYRCGIVVRGHGHTQMYYGVHEVDYDMLDRRPRARR